MTIATVALALSLTGCATNQATPQSSPSSMSNNERKDTLTIGVTLRDFSTMVGMGLGLLKYGPDSTLDVDGPTRSWIDSSLSDDEAKAVIDDMTTLMSGLQEREATRLETDDTLHYGVLAIPMEKVRMDGDRATILLKDMTVSDMDDIAWSGQSGSITFVKSKSDWFVTDINIEK